MADCITNTTDCLDCGKTLTGVSGYCSDGCADVTHSDCVIFDGETISNGIITINNLEHLTSIIQKLVEASGGSNISIQLTFNQSTRQLCLKKNGSNVSCVTIPDSDNQELSFDEENNTITISNGNTINLSSMLSAIGNIITDDNSGIDISTSGDDVVVNTIYNTSMVDTMMSQPIENTPSEAASVWKTRNIVEVLDRILFPEQLPTYTSPSINLSVTSGSLGTKEVGISQSATFLLSGNKNDAGAFTQLSLNRNSFNIVTTSSLSINSFIDVPDQFGYANPNSPNFSYSISQTDTFTLTEGIFSYTGYGQYNAGSVKKNNYGVDDTRPAQICQLNAPQSSNSNFASNYMLLIGVYPFFYGMNDNGTLSGTTLYSSLTKSVTTFSSKMFTYNDIDRYMYFAYPASYADLSSIKDPNGYEVLGSFTKTVSNVESTGLAANWDISYKIYRTNSKTTVNNGTFNFIF